MRTRTKIAIAATLLLGPWLLLLDCSRDEWRSPIECSYPDGATGSECVCFDGDLRCHPTCPADLTAPCAPPDDCADFSGGSAGEDCSCTCTASGSWSCTRRGEACIPH